jgi:predicted nucleic acid binding AN1-type Zn finger protein
MPEWITLPCQPDFHHEHLWRLEPQTFFMCLIILGYYRLMWLLHSQSWATFLDSKQSDIKATSKHYAVHYKNKILVAYAEDRIDGIALRLKQQINENSKAFCWYNIIPELNHNELVGWKQQHHAIGTLFIRTSFENMYATSIDSIF